MRSLSDVLLLLCGADANQEPALSKDLEQARARGVPVIPIVHGGQTLEGLAIPGPEPVPIARGVEFHDQMFAIKLLLVVREALGGERLAERGSAPRA